MLVEYILQHKPFPHIYTLKASDYSTEGSQFVRHLDRDPSQPIPTNSLTRSCADFGMNASDLNLEQQAEEVISYKAGVVC